MVRLCASGGRLNPQVQTWLDEAARLHGQGDIGAAASLYRRILAESPQEPSALLMLGVIAQQMAKPELALSLMDAAMAAQKDFVQAEFNRCVVLRALGRDEEALAASWSTLEAHPDLAVGWDLAGQILKDSGDFVHAEKCFTTALALQSGNPRFYGNYGLLLFAQGRLHEAYDAARKAQETDSTYPPILLGNILKAWGYPEKAAACFARARALEPALAEATASEAMARLQMGDMEQGWALWEQRPDLDPALAAIPFWQGEKCDHLLLYEDQGMGDAIQFLRYLPLLRASIERITLRVRDPLLRLCAENYPDIALLSEHDPAPKAEARCRLSSLPFFFVTRIQSIGSDPYLKAPEKSFWDERLRDRPSPRIGLVWAGNARFRNDASRSLDIQALAPLFACGAQHFVSIQKDRPDQALPAEIMDAAPQLDDLADTAALIAALDLVISVDTVTAHLAGALGKPAFILLPFSADWRWLLEREDSPWYGSARLFRQKTPGDWASVIDDVCAAVRLLIAGDNSVLRPQPWDGTVLRQHPQALPLPQ